jgi:glycine/D-amino acid oxidase-like deaminating enzyme/nitrite reductase/ring-hydroxylating ferredoxin subunit
VATGGPSFWLGTSPDTDYPSLVGDAEVDVAVVGGGIAGITVAALLKRAGRTVALLESKRIVRGASGYTTAKITSGHGAVYEQLEQRFGTDGARAYAASNQAAIERIARFVEEDGIACDFERKPNFVYAESDDEAKRLRREAEAEQRAGLPSSFTTETTLPFAVAGAVRLEGQAQFHPRKYLLALADSLPGDGSGVFERTRVLDVEEGEPCVVRTSAGVVRARDVVLATHLPILDRGLFFAKAHPHRSYAIAAPIEAHHAPDGMFINVGQPTRSVRTLRDGDRLYLNVGGEGHPAGRGDDTPRRYDALEGFLRTHWEAAPVAYRWSTEDFIAVDRVPYVGRLRRGSRHVFVATGFNKWGMTSATVAAMILADRVLGVENPWAPLYESKRLKPRAALKRFVTENGIVGVRWLTDRLTLGERRRLDSLQAGDGVVTRIRGRLTAVSRDDDGRLHALSPVCTHLRCIVGWNAAERSWDCPCHGSRFRPDGAVIQGPAVDDLERRSLRED